MDTIAVIEDNVLVGDMITEVLTQEGFRVLRAYSGTEALYLLRQRKPDLILLDLILPGLCGEEVLEHVEGIPVIILSSRAEVEDKIQLLNEGACDYITKPFHKKELIARILVQLRRDREPEEQETKDVLTYGELMLDMLNLTLSIPPQTVKLTKTEALILKKLIAHRNYTLSRSHLLESLSYESPDCTEKSLKQHMYNLRHKLAALSGTIQIQTIRGVGFRLTDGPEGAS